MAASTQLSSSVSSAVEKMDGKSVVSRSRLNSSGKINTFNGMHRYMNQYDERWKYQIGYLDIR